jgi:hypothetical protein
VSLLEDFARMRLYRNCASRYELLAERELLPEVRVRYRVIARHYRDLADREEQSDKAKIAKHLALLEKSVGNQQSEGAATNGRQQSRRDATTDGFAFVPLVEVAQLLGGLPARLGKLTLSRRLFCGLRDLPLRNTSVFATLLIVRRVYNSSVGSGKCCNDVK